MAILPLFSIVFYSKTIGKQKKLSEWVSPERSRSEFWHKAFSDSVDSNCKRFLETYFVSLNPITRLPREVVDLTDNLLFVGTNPKENVFDMMCHATDKVRACVLFEC